MITSTIKYTDRIESTLVPTRVVKSSGTNTNRIASALRAIAVVKSSSANTNRIYSTLVQRIRKTSIHILLLTDNSGFLLSDGSDLKVQTEITT